MIEEIKEILPRFRQAIICFVNSRSARPLDCYENMDLSCSCAIASRSLVVLLSRMGYKSKIAYGVFDEYNKFKRKKPILDDINHAWVEIEGYIIDLTASQFSRNRKKFLDCIVTNQIDKLYIKFGNANIRTLAPFSDWPHQQIPRMKYVNKILHNFQDLST